MSLRDPLREGASDDELEAIIRATWGERIDRYSEIRSSLTQDVRDRRKKVEMYHIGRLARRTFRAQSVHASI